MNLFIDDSGGGFLDFENDRVTLDCLNLAISLVRAEKCRLKTLTVDLRDVKLVDSGGVVTLVQLAKIVNDQTGSRVILNNLSKPVLNLLKTSHLVSHFICSDNSDSPKKENSHGQHQ